MRQHEQWACGAPAPARALREVAGAEHVYAAVIGDQVPHLHVHLLPGTRAPRGSTRGTGSTSGQRLAAAVNRRSPPWSAACTNTSGPRPMSDRPFSPSGRSQERTPPFNRPAAAEVTQDPHSRAQVLVLGRSPRQPTGCGTIAIARAGARLGNAHQTPPRHHCGAQAQLRQRRPSTAAQATSPETRRQSARIK